MTKFICEPMGYFLPANDNLPRLLLRGIDSLYVGFYPDFPAANLGDGAEGFQWLFLATEKEKLRSSKREQFSEITLESETFLLRRNGLGRYTYVLDNEDFTVQLAEHMQPRCHIQFSSKGLWRHGAEALVQRVHGWINSLGGVESRAPTISRVDFSFDFAVGNRDFELDHFVSRAASDGQWRKDNRPQTWTFGKGDLMARVYDKSAEINEASGKTFFWELWGQKEGVWRVEFQARKPVLRKHGVMTPEDIEALGGDFLRETATRFLTLRKPNGDSNRSRWPYHPLWKVLLEEINQAPQTGLVRSFDPLADNNWRLHLKGKSLLGMLKSIGAGLAIRQGAQAPPDLDAVLGALPSLLRPHYHQIEWEADVQSRITQHRHGKW